MRHLRRPSPALIVSVVALFLALGGMAFAVSRNSVGTKQIKNNSIRGIDVREKTLGPVPSLGGLKVKKFDNFTLNSNQSRVLLTRGPLTLTARCQIAVDPDGAGGNPPFDNAAVEISTSENNAAFDGDDDDADFDIADSPEDFMFSSNGTTGEPEMDNETDGLATSAEGNRFYNLGFFTGANLFGQTGVCNFGGYIGFG